MVIKDLKLSIIIQEMVGNNNKVYIYNNNSFNVNYIRQTFDKGYKCMSFFKRTEFKVKHKSLKKFLENKLVKTLCYEWCN